MNRRPYHHWTQPQVTRARELAAAGLAMHGIGIVLGVDFNLESPLTSEQVRHCLTYHCNLKRPVGKPRGRPLGTK